MDIDSSLIALAAQSWSLIQRMRKLVFEEGMLTQKHSNGITTASAEYNILTSEEKKLASYFRTLGCWESDQVES